MFCEKNSLPIYMIMPIKANNTDTVVHKKQVYLLHQIVISVDLETTFTNRFHQKIFSRFCERTMFCLLSLIPSEMYTAFFHAFLFIWSVF